MCDYTELKNRLWDEIDCVRKYEHWSYEHVCAMKKLLESLKYVNEIERMGWENEEWKNQHMKK